MRSYTPQQIQQLCKTYRNKFDRALSLRTQLGKLDPESRFYDTTLDRLNYAEYECRELDDRIFNAVQMLMIETEYQLKPKTK